MNCIDYELEKCYCGLFCFKGLVRYGSVFIVVA